MHHKNGAPTGSHGAKYGAKKILVVGAGVEIASISSGLPASRRALGKICDSRFAIRILGTSVC